MTIQGQTGRFLIPCPTVARLARIAVANIPYHVTQRGNARQTILSSDPERGVYLELLRKYAELYDLSLLGYCLMSNHVHLVVVPRKAQSLATALKQTHGRYASYWNALHKSSGHVWQGRFYSCPMDDAHLWIALRYVELNPVRAKMVADASVWNWSSAAAHCGEAQALSCLDVTKWSARWSTRTWRKYLSCGEPEYEVAAIRRSTHTGRPLGAEAFVESLELATQRRLSAQIGGRPRSNTPDSNQPALSFENEQM